MPANMPGSHVRRETGALSASASQVDLTPTWKQEVNQRLAAHMSRRGGATAELDAPGVVKRGASSLAAEAAARVAARYAKAPSYSEMLAGEARAAVRAAEAASRAALEAQAAAEFVLAGLEAGSVTEQPWEPGAFHGGGSERALEQVWEASVEPAKVAGLLPGVASGQASGRASDRASSEAMERQSYGIRWEADLPVRDAAPEALRATHGAHRTSVFETSVEDWWESSAMARDAHRSLEGDEGIEVVEPAQPLHANLIEFPRELVATRKVRPRLAEGPYAAAGDAVGQLSIFEVDPGSISTEPAAAEIVTVPAAAWASPGWSSPDWLSIKLDEPYVEAIELEDDPAPAAVALQPASMGLRLMATVVDCSLMTGAFLAAALVVMDKAKDLPAIKEIELGSVVALLAIGVVYQVFFFTLGAATPGMKWAHISLCTLGNRKPTRGQRCGRLGAFLLSLLPVGLGVAWAIFDEEHLSWHDRLSGTYLRKS